jgi:hypothetical protein
MKTILLQLLGLCLFFPSASRAADTNPPPRLTVELRDGSRVVGESLDKNFKFHSALFGDLKLAVKDIRSLDCAKTNFAKLVTVNGDELTVAFAESDFAIKTSFGKVELATASVRRFTVSTVLAGGMHRPGLVALWAGEGDAKDRVGGHDGTLNGDVSFEAGKVGKAFHFNGSNADVEIPCSSDLTPTSFTIECWVKLDSLDSQVASRPGLQTIVFKNNTRHTCFEGYTLFKDRDNQRDEFRLGVSSAAGQQILVDTKTVPEAGVWYHLAGTYDGGTGHLKIYVNGELESSAYAGFPLDYGIGPVCVGKNGEWMDGRLQGVVDELAIYRRALSDQEIREDYEVSK